MRCNLVRSVLVSISLGGTGLLAQHAGPAGPTPAHAAGHTGTALHASPSPSRNFSAPTGLSPNRFPQAGRTGHWPSWNAGNNYRAPLRQRYPYVYPDVYPGLLSFGYGLPAGYASPYDDGGPAGAPDPGPAPGVQAAENPPLLYRPAYQGPAEAPVHPQPATNLIFKDGRPPQQVHNYALTGTTIWDLDGETRQEIPLILIDIPATVKANRDAGVDFALPSSR